jgi:mannose-1-phosphate guanylyltransferase/mannose-6-phosphate isomerase
MLIPVILSGGAGTRLWPVSREAFPKPFIRLSNGKSLLQNTLARAAKLDGVEKALTVTNRDYYFQTKDEYDDLLLPQGFQLHYNLEPCPRGTAPAIAMAALYVSKTFGDDATVLILPADHLITDMDTFNRAVIVSSHLAEKDYLVTFGIKPLSAETGYGYIESAESIDLNIKDGSIKDTITAAIVEKFVEKPTHDVAKKYVDSGRYLWNSGMFCFKANIFLEVLKEHAPDIHSRAIACWEETKKEKGISEFSKNIFSDMPNISIDYALMEKAQNVAVVGCNIGWSDMGSWTSMSDLVSADKEGNRLEGDAEFLDSHDCYIRSDDRFVAALGIRDTIIIDTHDALLVTNKDHIQHVKKIVKILKEKKNETYRLHRTVYRPWGSYTTIEEGEGYKIKRIIVKHGRSLSLQMHHHRSEHWNVVFGTAKVLIENEEFLVRTNESTYIPSGTKHRLTNPGTLDLILIEVQIGQYLGEDDITRFEDDYGRQ